MFHLAPDPYRDVPEAILSEPMSAITNKLKFVVCLDCPPMYRGISGPETLVAAYYYFYRTPTFAKMLLEILNKRWQTLDVKSMMSELQRSYSQQSGFTVTEDNLLSVHRFKRKEGASLSSKNWNL